jgi:hypothetical protein
MMSFFERNLAALSHLDPPLAARMKSVPWPSPAATLKEARAGKPTLRAVSHDGQDILLHSEYDPVGEARDYVESRKPGRTDAYVLNGFGLGYVALELSARLDRHRWIACIEAQEELFRASLEAVDLAPLMSRGRVKFFVGHNWIDFQTWLRAFLAESEAFTLTLMTYPPCVRLLPQFYAAAGSEVETAVNRRRVEVNTLVHHAENMERNAIRNLPVIARSHGVKDFEGLFAGVPAAVVGAGPSLNAALPHLRAMKGRGVIVAVGKALKLLLAEGIVPEFVVHLDMIPGSADYFRGFEIPPELVLVLDPDCFHEVPAGYRGPAVSYETVVEINRWSRAFLGERGFLDKGLSVAHTAFYFARATGADPLLLVGVDCAFPGERTHAEGVTMTWGGRTEEQKLDFISIPGVRGEPVRSLPNFFSFVTAFEVEVPRTKARVVQTSEIGAFIRGAEHLPLAQAVERYATREAPLAEKVRQAAARPAAFDAAAFRKSGSLALDGMARAAESAEAGLRSLKQIRRLDPRNRLEQADWQRLRARLNGAKAELLREGEVPRLLQRLLAGTALEIRELNRALEGVPASDPAGRTRLELRQFELLFQGYRDAAAFFVAEFRPVYEEMLRDYGT